MSDAKIKVPRIKREKGLVRGADWFPTKYPNMYFCSLKGSGKSVALTNAMWHCIGKNTKVIICSPTVNIDQTYISTVAKLTRNGHQVEVFGGINDDGTNVIREFLEEQKRREDDDPEDDEPIVGFADHRGDITVNPPKKSARDMLYTVLPTYQRDKNKTPISSGPSALTTVHTKIVRTKPLDSDVTQSSSSQINISNNISNNIPDEKKQKVITPDWIFIIDDCGDEARNKYLQQLMKTNRHYKAMILIASQHLNDLAPASIKQLQYIFLFARFSFDKLNELYKSLQLSIDFEKFVQLYNDATSVPYGFLYIGREPSGDKFRKGFTEQYMI